MEISPEAGELRPGARARSRLSRYKRNTEQNELFGVERSRQVTSLSDAGEVGIEGSMAKRPVLLWTPRRYIRGNDGDRSLLKRCSLGFAGAGP